MAEILGRTRAELMASISAPELQLWGVWFEVKAEEAKS